MSVQVIVFGLLYAGGSIDGMGLEGLGGSGGMGLGEIEGGGLGPGGDGLGESNGGDGLGESNGGDGLGLVNGVGGREGSKKNDPNSPSLHNRLPGAVEPILQLKGNPTY